MLPVIFCRNRYGPVSCKRHVHSLMMKRHVCLHNLTALFASRNATALLASLWKCRPLFAHANFIYPFLRNRWDSDPCSLWHFWVGMVSGIRPSSIDIMSPDILSFYKRCTFSIHNHVSSHSYSENAYWHSNAGNNHNKLLNLSLTQITFEHFNFRPFGICSCMNSLLENIKNHITVSENNVQNILATEVFQRLRSYHIWIYNIKRPELEADHSHPSSAEIHNNCSSLLRCHRSCVYNVIFYF